VNPPDLRLSLQGDDQDPARARAAMQHFLDDRPSGAETQDIVALLVTELVTNAVLHGGPPMHLDAHFEEERDLLHVAVHDGSSRPPRLREPRAAGGGGFGLHVVEALAGSWGVTEEPVGKDVWFEVSVGAGPRP